MFKVSKGSLQDLLDRQMDKIHLRSESLYSKYKIYTN